jgi:polyisoprenyl-phosphate glycosyltransferase
MDISVIVPVYNEEANLPLLYQRLKNTVVDVSLNHEIIFVNDGSTDNSLAVIRELTGKDSQSKYIDLSKNFGHQIAVYAGLEHADGNAIVIIDSDLQDPPELIREMYKKLHDGHDVVYAQREHRKGESWHKLLTAKLFYRLINRLSDVAIPVDTGDFRIISKKVRDIICSMHERNKFLRGQIAWVGFNQAAVFYQRDERHAGRTSYPYSKMLKFAWDGITSFSNTPLRIATFFGFLVSVFAFFVILYSLYQKYINNNVIQGWTSIMISVLFIGGVQLICLGIIGEYIGRILDNVKDRPVYIVKDKNF